MSTIFDLLFQGVVGQVEAATRRGPREPRTRGCSRKAQDPDPSAAGASCVVGGKPSCPGFCWEGSPSAEEGWEQKQYGGLSTWKAKCSC
jgi:hypothetical protein